MLKPYPLQKNDEFAFEFLTINGIRYIIYFLDYSYMFDTIQHLQTPVYSLNIDVIEGDPDHSIGDERVGLTVFEVVNLFFKHKNNVAVYVCDSLDKRQLARKRKFDLWFFMYNEGNIVKEDGMVIIEETEILNTILIHVENSQAEEIIEAFKILNQSNSRK